VIEPRTIVVSLLVGTIVTVLSGLFPALRATRVPPVAAMREGAVLPPGRGHRLVTPLAILLVLGGGAALAAGLSGSGGIGLVGFGGAAIFVGIALLSPRFVKPIAAVVGAPIERTRGITGRLARENTIRQPGRTAVTAAALMIGVTLVAFVSIFAAGAKSSIDNAVDAAVVPGTLIVQNTNGFGTVPVGAAQAIAEVPGVRTVAPIGFTQGRAQGIGKKISLSSIDPGSFAEVYDARWKEGSQAVLVELGTPGAVASKGFADGHDLKVGSQLRVLTATGQRVPLTVKGIVDDRGRLLADLTITQRLAAQAFGERDIALAFAGVAPADEARVKAQVDRVLKQDFPVAEAKTLQQFKDDQAGQVDQLLNLIYVLLSLAVIVSLFGIVNTLALSIHERTRELGMLRAIGTTRRQVRAMVRYEAVITSLIGAVLGVILGVLLAIAITQPLKDDGFVLSIPVGTLVFLLILAFVAGALAAIGPARRASRLDVLDALAYE
jgi:putative ABC transport system permease protein